LHDGGRDRNVRKRKLCNGGADWEGVRGKFLAVKWLPERSMRRLNGMVAAFSGKGGTK